MFSTGERDVIREKVIDRARHDGQVTACVVLGSAARGEEDAWSDIDIGLQVAKGAALEQVADRWTKWLSDLTDVADSLSVCASDAMYRVFLLSNSLQLDLSFWPVDTLRSTGEPIRLIFGSIGAPDVQPEPEPLRLVRMGWLYALHARSAIARGRSLQADMMLTELRNQVIALACHREGLNPAQGRGAHLLPRAMSAQLVASRALSLAAAEQARCLRETLAMLRAETAHHRVISRSFDDALDALSSIRPADDSDR